MARGGGDISYSSVIVFSRRHRLTGHIPTHSTHELITLHYIIMNVFSNM